MEGDGGTRQGRTAHAGNRLLGLVSAVLDPAARRRGFAQASLLADWPTIVGAALARRCQPVRVEHAPGAAGRPPRARVLQLQPPAAAALEIQHAAPQIVERVNTYFGYAAVRQLRLQQVPMRAPVPPARPALAVLSPEAEADLVRAVGPIEDEELRSALLSLGRRVRGTRS